MTTRGQLVPSTGPLGCSRQESLALLLVPQVTITGRQGGASSGGAI